jgi:plasmid segregation protein ParM
MLIAIEHGNKQIKLAGGRAFTSGLRESSIRPPFGEDVLKYKDKYYTITEQRIPFMRDKSVDERFYILTLFAIAFELEDTGKYHIGMLPVQLAVGLPPAHYGSQYEQFEKYFRRGVIEEFEFHGKKHRIHITEATAYPQAFAAVMPVYNTINALPKVTVVDIGGFTADYLVIRNGQADLSACDSLEHGVIILCNQIIARLNSELDILLDESDIDAILMGRDSSFSDNIKHIVVDTAQVFVSDLFGKLRERAVDLRSGKVVFVGGGSMLVRKQIEALGIIPSPIFIDNLSANAKGYELLHKASGTRKSEHHAG